MAALICSKETGIFKDDAKKVLDLALDITGPRNVNIHYDRARNVLYVHVNGVTLMRVNNPQSVHLDVPDESQS